MPAITMKDLEIDPKLIVFLTAFNWMSTCALTRVRVRILRKLLP